MAKELVTIDSPQGIDSLIDLMGKHQRSIKEMLGADNAVMCREDMKYFGKEWFGRLPSYERFTRELRRNNPQELIELKRIEAEILGSRYEESLRDIYTKPASEMDGSESKRFNWGEKLYKIQERKIDRLDKQSERNGVERGVDLACKIIEAMSDAKLVKLKKIMDAEWEEVQDGGSVDRGEH